MKLNPPEDETLSSLLRSELAAVESYHLAIRCFPELVAHPLLEGIRADHSRAVELLKNMVVAHGGNPPAAGEPWDCLAAVPAKAQIFSPLIPTLAAFVEGEKHTVSRYKMALEDDGLPCPAKAVIRDELLPLAWKNWMYVQTMIT